MDQSRLQTQTLALASALPAPWYTDPDQQRVDERAVFARSWQLAGHASAVSASGDHLVTRIGPLPVIVVRGADGQLRAFHNVCRHRAAPLAWCSGRGARELRCRYHGWTYTLAGQLRTAPEMADAAHFDLPSVHLPQIEVQVWNGLVFVAAKPQLPFSDLVAGIDVRTGGIDFSTWGHSFRIDYEIACDWKAYVDNYLEGYHVPHIHPELNRLLDYRSYRTELSPWHSLQYSPLESGGELYGSGAAYYYFLYPNTMLNILPGRMQTNRVVPLGTGRCRVEFEFFYRDAEAAARADADRAFSDEVQHEDIRICEAVQAGLASGSYDAGRLNAKRESGVFHFHELLRADYRADAGVVA